MPPVPHLKKYVLTSILCLLLIGGCSSRPNIAPDEQNRPSDQRQQTSVAIQPATPANMPTLLPTATPQPTIATPTSRPSNTPTPQPTSANQTQTDISTAAPVEPVTYTYEIINTYPHDRSAFTQGLVFTDAILYEGTGLKGQSTLRKVELDTGQVLQRYDLPDQFFGEGITIFNERLIQLTYQARLGFVYDKDSFAPNGEFTYPTEGWGLTHDGQRLIMSDGTANLYFLDPDTFAEIGRVEVRNQFGPVNNLNELEYIHGQVYANIWKTNFIAIINPHTGQVVGWINLAGLLSQADFAERVDVLNGIAYDAKGDRLFVTGKWWPKLFEIKLVPAE